MLKGVKSCVKGPNVDQATSLTSMVWSEMSNGTDQRIPLTHHQHAMFGTVTKKGLILEYIETKPFKFK